MRKKLLTTLLVFISLTTIADNPKTHLVLWTKDGDIKMFALAEKPKIRFTSSKLIITKKGGNIISELIGGKDEVSFSFSLENIRRFTYESITSNGDVNGDGIINIADVTTAISNALGRNTDKSSFEAADINGDGKVDFIDITIILYMIFCGDSQNSPVNEGIIEDLNDLLGQLINEFHDTRHSLAAAQSNVMLMV